jgi:hypothetical protein
MSGSGLEEREQSLSVWVKRGWDSKETEELEGIVVGKEVVRAVVEA